MGKKELFAKYHFNQAMSLLVVAILVVSWQVVLEDTNLFRGGDEGVVKGEQTVKGSGQKELVVDYQNKVKNIINNYLEERASFDKPHQDWLFLINNAKYQILNLNVPDDYKELHVKLAALLDAEYGAVSGEKEISMDEINARWVEILEQYFWLND